LLLPQPRLRQPASVASLQHRTRLQGDDDGRGSNHAQHHRQRTAAAPATHRRQRQAPTPARRRRPVAVADTTATVHCGTVPCRAVPCTPHVALRARCTPWCDASHDMSPCGLPMSQRFVRAAAVLGDSIRNQFAKTQPLKRDLCGMIRPKHTAHRHEPTQHNQPTTTAPWGRACRRVCPLWWWAPCCVHNTWAPRRHCTRTRSPQHCTHTPTPPGPRWRCGGWGAWLGGDS